MSEENRKIADTYAGSWWNRKEMSRSFVVMRDELGKLLDEAERRGAEKFRDGVIGALNNYPDITVDDLARIKNEIYALPLEGPKDGRDE